MQKYSKDQGAGKLCKELTFCSGLMQTTGHPRNLLGPGFVFGLQVLPLLMCFFEQTLL